jgi:integrase
MATIRQIPSGWWQGIIRKKGHPQQSKTFELKRDCEIWATDVESKMNRGMFSDMSEAESITIGEALTKYLHEVTPLKKGAYQETNRIQSLIANPKVSSKTLATFKGFDCAKIRDEMLKANLSASTIQKKLSIFSHLYEVARKDWGINCINPVKQISKPKVDNARERRLSPLEEVYLLRVLDTRAAGSRSNQVCANIVRFALETAMRQGELFKMTWAMVDLAQRVVMLSPEITKNGKSRGVPLSSIAVKIIEAEAAGGIARIKRGKVFKTTQSATVQSFGRGKVRAIKLYEAETSMENRVEDFLHDFHFHDLRHEAISRLANVFQMHELMKVTGHADSRMLARYYHPKAEDLAKKLA